MQKHKIKSFFFVFRTIFQFINELKQRCSEVLSYYRKVMGIQYFTLYFWPFC